MHAGKGEITGVHYSPLDLSFCFPPTFYCVEKQQGIAQRGLDLYFKTWI